MDPLVEALIAKYGMSYDLAQRTASGLRAPGAATNAYPAVADQIQPAPTPSGGYGAPAFRGRGSATKGPAKGQSQPSIEQQRVAHYDALQQQLQNGEDIGAENHAWLQKVQQVQAASKAGSSLGPKSIGVQLTPAEMAVQNLEAMTRANVPTAAIQGYWRSTTKPVVDVADTAKLEQLGDTRLTPYNKNYRTLDRHASDVSMQDTDAFAQHTLEQAYGNHLKAVEDNGGKFPAGYFDAMSPADKENIRYGVQELMRRQRGTRI
jgi:hypothetical protein